MGDPIGELFVKVMPDTTGFGPAVAAQTGAATSGALSAVSKGSTVALAGVLAVGGGLVAMGSAADDAYDNIRQGTGATGEALAGLEDSFKTVLANVPTDAASAGSAIADLNTALGLTGDALESRSKQFLELSRITGTDLGSNIQKVTGLFNQLGVAEQDQEQFLDNLFQVYQASGVSVDKLADQLLQIGPTLQAFGFDTAESTALVGALGKAGLDATKLLPGFNRVLKDAAAAGEDPRAVLENLFNTINSAPDATSAAQAALEAFGPRAGPILAQQIREGGLAIDDLWESVGAGEDTIIGVGEETKDFKESLLELKNKVFVALEPAATKLFTSIGKTVESLAPSIVLVVEAIAPMLELFASIPAPLQALIVGGLAFGAVASKLVGPIMGVIKVFKLLSATLATNPWILVAAAVVALAIVIYKNWDKILAFLKKVWAAIQVAAEAVWNAIKIAITAVIEAIETAITATWNAIKTATEAAWNFIKDVTTAVWDAIKAAFEAVLSAIATVIATYIDIYKTIILTAWEAIKTATQFVWDLIKTVITTVWNTITTIVTTAVNLVRSIIETAWEGLRVATETAWNLIKGAIDIASQGIQNLITNITNPVEFLKGLWGDLRSAAEGAWDGIVNAVQGAWDRLQVLFADIRNAADRALGPVDEIIGKGAGIVGKGASAIGGLFGRALGGPVYPNSPVMVGEKGPEVFFPNRAGAILSNRELGAALTGGSGGMTVNGPLVAFSGPVSLRDDRDATLLAREVAKATDAERRGKGQGVYNTL